MLDLARKSFLLGDRFQQTIRQSDAGAHVIVKEEHLPEKETYREAAFVEALYPTGMHQVTSDEVSDRPGELGFPVVTPSRTDDNNRDGAPR